jgi:hypothetical protein
MVHTELAHSARAIEFSESLGARVVEAADERKAHTVGLETRTL